MSVKKILFIVDRLGGGAGSVIYNIAAFLDKKKFIPVVATIYNDGNESNIFFKKQGIKVLSFNKSSGKDFGVISRLKNFIKKEKFDIVHTHNVDGYEYGVPAARLAGVKKIIHTAHGKSIKSGYKRLREKAVHNICSAFITDYVSVSTDLAGYACKNWCSNKKKIKVLYNGVDLNKFKKHPVDRNLLRKFGLKSGKVVGIVAGLRSVKDHATIIKAMRIVANSIPDVKLLVVGDGPEGHKLVELVNELNLSKNILFLGNRDDTVKIYNCLDVCVLSSLSECLSMTLLEAMACEVACVATNVGGNPEAVMDNKTGFIVPPKNPEALAEKIIALLKNKPLRESFGKHGRARALKYFNVKDMVKDYEDIYEDM